MDQSLLELMEDLIAATEQRDGCDPDAPAWEAAARVRRLELEIAARLAEARADAGEALPRAFGARLDLGVAEVSGTAG
jgi:hypothetical protein